MTIDIYGEIIGYEMLMPTKICHIPCLNVPYIVYVYI